MNLKKFDRAHDHFTQALDLVKLRGKRAADRPKLVHQVHHEALQLLEGAEPRRDQEQGGGAGLSQLDGLVVLLLSEPRRDQEQGGGAGLS